MMAKWRTAHLFFLCFLGFAAGLYSAPDIDEYTDKECLECHGKSNLAQILSDGTVRSLYVDPEAWAQDVHKMGNLACVDCHRYANPYVHFREGFVDVDCAKCHPEQSEEYLKNVHFEFSPLLPERDLPLCYDCHTKHNILRHDHPSASIHKNNIDSTCATCHPEVMVEGLLKGASIGKISGHRKGDISEKFDMAICIQCHNPSHGPNTVYRDYCTRCHDPNKKAEITTGPTHLNSSKWIGYNAVGGSLALFLILGTFVYLGYRSRTRFGSAVKDWHESMKFNEEPKGETEVKEQDKEKDEEMAQQPEKVEPDGPESAEGEIRQDMIERKEEIEQEKPEDTKPEQEDNEP
jgi:hypothetical protein